MHNHLHHIHPIFSIITVTYNAENVLEDTIQSIIAQTYKHIEYIIVDGGSKDGTLKLIQQYEPHIQKWISEPDKGLYDAMNKGMKMATGDYICFLNAGDQLYDIDTLGAIVRSIPGNILPDVIYGETALINENGDFLRMRRLSAPEHLNWKSFKEGMLVCHQAFFARRRHAVEELYDLHYKFSADFDWCIRIMKKSSYLHNTHLTLINYLSEGITTKNHKASLKERFHIMVKHYGWFSTVSRHIWFTLRLLLKK